MGTFNNHGGIKIFIYNDILTYRPEYYYNNQMIHSDTDAQTTLVPRPVIFIFKLTYRPCSKLASARETEY